MENILVLQQVSKKFGQQYALTDVSLTIKKGDIYGLIGKNGAGKTTLIKIIAQLLESDSGSVLKIKKNGHKASSGSGLSSKLRLLTTT